MIVREERTFL